MGTIETVENKFKVPKRQWSKWKVANGAPQYVFNDVYAQMIGCPEAFRHPSVRNEGPEDHARVTAWNAAWTAASSVRDALSQG